MRPTGSITALTLALLAVAAPAQAAEEDLYFTGSAREERPRSVPALGYGRYAATFYDLSYTFESSAWVHPGQGTVSLSGVSYTENKGLLTNILAMILVR